MQYFQRLESGDKIFFIDDENQIKEIKLKYEHLKEDEHNRKTLDGHYQLKSNTVEIGSYTPLTKVTYHEEMEWNGHHVMNRWFEYEDTDKVAYLSLIYQRDVMDELQSDAKNELEPHLTAVKQILSNYFDLVDRHDIEASFLKSEDHQVLVKLRDSIDF